MASFDEIDLKVLFKHPEQGFGSTIDDTVSSIAFSVQSKKGFARQKQIYVLKALRTLYCTSFVRCPQSSLARSSGLGTILLNLFGRSKMSAVNVLRLRPETTGYAVKRETIFETFRKFKSYSFFDGAAYTQRHSLEVVLVAALSRALLHQVSWKD